MRIAIISDIHDNLWELQRVLQTISAHDALLCLGDFCSPFTLTTIAEGFHGPVHAVFGNNDGDRLALARVAERAPNLTLHGFSMHLLLDGRRIAGNHYPEIAQPLAESGQYDLVCHGHDHQRCHDRIGETWLVNPGEVMGRFGVVSYGLYDAVTHQASVIELSPRRR
ncbi:MAG: metallophosphoesterase family protein [Chloroflexi bacterium]|nr:metallophosphoesterase family protein [Chloroflexota bacterium]